MVEDRLSESILGGRFQTGDTAVVDLEAGEVVVHPPAAGVVSSEGSSPSE
jgi:hypothetical protein